MTDTIARYIGGPCCGDAIGTHQALPLTTGDYAVANPIIGKARLYGTFVYRPSCGDLQFVEAA